MNHLICPPGTNELTGGFIFNREIAARIKIDLKYRFVPKEEIADYIDSLPGRGETVVLDSLYFGEPGVVQSISKHDEIRYGILAQYLPSLDPDLDDLERELKCMSETSLLSKADFCITPSRFLASQIQLRTRSEKTPAIHVCVPGVSDDFKTMRAKQSWSGRLITVANLTPLKGYHILAEALASLKGENWTWEIIGDHRAYPDYTHQILELLENADIRDRVVFRGRLSGAALVKSLCNSDLFLFPSRMESYGMACAEALASGLPVVANRVGGIPEIVLHGKNGYLCDEPNPEEWIDALTILFSSAANRNLLAKAPRGEQETSRTWEDTARDFKRALS